MVTKFRDQITKLDDGVGEVLRLEAHEKTIQESENQVKKAEKIVEGKAPEKRTWFQRKTEREFLRGKERIHLSVF